MSPLINWDENLPSDGSSVGIGAAEIRSVWAALVAGLNESLEWDGTVPGQLRAGAAPSFITTEANIASLWGSNSSSAGKLAFASDTSRLFTLALNSNTGRASFAGGPQLMEHADEVQRGVAWHIGSGASLLVTPDGTSVITYRSDGLGGGDAIIYGAVPQVLVTSDNTDYMPITTSITTAEFTVRMRPIQHSATNVTIRWVSSGTSTI